MIFVWVLISVVIAVAVWLLWFWVIDLFVSHSKRQSQFIQGKVPTPDGFYQGSAYLLGNIKTPWLGKSFAPVDALGFNIFTPGGAGLLKVLTPLYKLFRKNADGNTEAYNFKTSVGPGFKDKNIQTFKLDYNSPENPFLIRIILDEMVELDSGEYLGKVHVKVLPGYHATIGFFGLEK